MVGTYSGLFICTNGPVTPTNSGFFTFTVSPGGGFTGRLLFPAYRPLPISDPISTRMELPDLVIRVFREIPLS